MSEILAQPEVASSLHLSRRIYIRPVSREKELMLGVLDKSRSKVSNAGMKSRKVYASREAEKRFRAASLSAVRLLLLCALISGCAAAPLAKQTTALSIATAPVIDQAAAAYREAQAIHSQRVDYDAAQAFEKTSVFVPSSIQVWPSEKDIQTRLAVLTALQLYVKELSEITGGTDSTALDAASKSMGNSLSSLANTLAPAAESALGIAPSPATTTQTTVNTTSGGTSQSTTTISSTPPPLISADAQKGVAVAIDALGQFLVNRTIEKGLPPKIVAMDPHIKALCELLANDIGILQSQEKFDSNDIIDVQTDLARNPKLDPEERRAEFLKLPEMARQQQANDQILTELRASLVRLELAHHALAAEAQGNSPGSIKEKLGDLESAGESLGKFYSSLSSAK
jgi:hypothetical protein